MRVIVDKMEQEIFKVNSVYYKAQDAEDQIAFHFQELSFTTKTPTNTKYEIDEICQQEFTK